MMQYNDDFDEEDDLEERGFTIKGRSQNKRAALDFLELQTEDKQGRVEEEVAA